MISLSLRYSLIQAPLAAVPVRDQRLHIQHYRLGAKLAHQAQPVRERGDPRLLSSHVFIPSASAPVRVIRRE
jgi:hypothetical protein